MSGAAIVPGYPGVWSDVVAGILDVWARSSGPFPDFFWMDCVSRLEMGARLASEPDFDLGPVRVRPSACCVVAGEQEVRVEAQTMVVLVELAQADGATVTKEELIDRCWRGRVVTDDAIARTIAKVRAVSRGSASPAFMLQTVPKIGYRLIATEAARDQIAPNVEPPQRPNNWRTRLPLTAAGAVLAVGAVLGGSAIVTQPSASHTASTAVLTPHATEVFDAVVNADHARMALYLENGWAPNWHIDAEGNTALHNLMMACERNRSHDQAAVVRVAQLLVVSGADPSLENKWGDTPLIIASTPRYCGPDHPVVAFLRGLPQAR
jgi:DNA-binding winged helix-turn-helix (wHTH) protein